MFINISSDKIYIGTGNKNIFLDRNGIQDVLGPKLIKLQNKNKFKDILVLNGPGGFTNLRVSTLCLNLLNTLQKNKIKIYDINKIQLYNHLYKKGFTPRYSVIYIGQKKNIRLYDFQKQKYTTQTIENIKINDNYFLDQVYEKGYYSKLNKNYLIKITFKKKILEIKYKSQTTKIKLKDLKLKAQNQIQPNYMIEPQMN